MCFCDAEEILPAVRFGFDIFIFTNLSTAARKRQGWVFISYFSKLCVQPRTSGYVFAYPGFVYSLCYVNFKPQPC